MCVWKIKIDKTLKIFRIFLYTRYGGGQNLAVLLWPSRCKFMVFIGGERIKSRRILLGRIIIIRIKIIHRLSEYYYQLKICARYRVFTFTFYLVDSFLYKMRATLIEGPYTYLPATSPN